MGRCDFCTWVRGQVEATTVTVYASLRGGIREPLCGVGGDLTLDDPADFFPGTTQLVRGL